MKKLLVGILLAVVLAFSATAGAVSWEGDGWGTCNTAGNYGGWDKVSTCLVAWNGVCSEASRDATFLVGAEGSYTNKIIIEHLDGIAETMDSFEVKDASGQVLCSFTDVTSGTEVWKTLECTDFSQFEGVKTLTLHPTASAPWTGCPTWGQVAIRNITFEGNQVPEFTTVAALVALCGAALGVVVLKKKN